MIFMKSDIAYGVQTMNAAANVSNFVIFDVITSIIMKK
jgi:hypothetical protein